MDNNREELKLTGLLNKGYKTWTVDEAAFVCLQFVQHCDSVDRSVSRQHITQLWHYWLYRQPDKPLFDEPRFNMEVMLTAQAFGEEVPLAGANSFLGRYRLDYSAYEKPFAPVALIWGPRACFNLVSGPTLFSAVSHVYVFRANDQIEEILIVGHGPPELQQEIYQAVLACIMTLKVGELDLLNHGLYRVVSPNKTQHLFNLPGITPQGKPPAVATPTIQTVNQALNELLKRLETLSSNTALVTIHACNSLTQQEFDNALRSYASAAFRSKQITIVAKKAQNRDNKELAKMTTLVPCYQIEAQSSPLQVSLHPDMLALESFQRVLSLFMLETVERLKGATKARLESYITHLTNLYEEQKRWEQADERSRRILWPEFAVLQEHFDTELGVTVRLNSPQKIPYAVYMTRNVPFLIKHYKEWKLKMEDILSNIEELEQRPDKPIQRLCVSSLLDAILREIEPGLLDVSIRSHFQRWKEQVAPLLRFKWWFTFASKGINPEAIFTRQTIFHTRFQLNQNGQTVTNLIVQPFTVISPTHAVLVFDPAQHTMLVHCPADYAEAFQPSSAPEEGTSWKRLEHALGKAGATQATFTAELRHLLEQTPFELLPQLVTFLCEIVRPMVAPMWNEERLKKNEKT